MTDLRENSEGKIFLARVSVNRLNLNNRKSFTLADSFTFQSAKCSIDSAPSCLVLFNSAELLAETFLLKGKLDYRCIW